MYCQLFLERLKSDFEALERNFIFKVLHRLVLNEITRKVCQMVQFSIFRTVWLKKSRYPKSIVVVGIQLVPRWFRHLPGWAVVAAVAAGWKPGGFGWKPGGSGWKPGVAGRKLGGSGWKLAQSGWKLGGIGWKPGATGSKPEAPGWKLEGPGSKPGESEFLVKQFVKNDLISQLFSG